MADIKDLSLKTIGSSIKNAVSDLLSNGDFISRTIGMDNSYEDIMFIVQALGREPISLLGKDYAFIYDHVRRNYLQGIDTPSKNFDFCNKFTFYKEVPTVRFADPYNDPMNLKDRWKASFISPDTEIGEKSFHYSESTDGITNNRYISSSSDLEYGNPGTRHGSIESYGPNLKTCDMIGKTNSNFNHGKYETLIARFHTNTQESKSQEDPTQSANSKEYGLSHGRNLLKLNKSDHNGYDNPYCRVWTYQHQYNQIKRQIRPLVGEGGQGISADNLEEYERVGGKYNTVSFRTTESGDGNSKFDGGSKRLDDYGVLNYQNGTVNIAPTAKIVDYFKGHQSKYNEGKIETKKCMFSIENLAWRDDKSDKSQYDENGLSPEQKGPLGGRIMWFPPYDLSFNEDVSVKWNSNEFIGRGENIYTYTNTERRGNLSFTLLIDHPSILDYWTGHYAPRGDLKNQGKPLDSGNIGGVDNKMNQENTLLRFFAGCEILTAKPQEYDIRDVKPESDDEKKKDNPMDTPPPTDVVKSTLKKTIYCFAFYPNNYSGKDDGNGIVNPIHYLLNGIGTQKRVNEITKNADDFMVDMKHEVSKSGYGGYEMRDGNGISIVTDPLDSGYTTIRSTYADLISKEKKAQYLTEENGEKQEVYYVSGDTLKYKDENDNEHYPWLAKQVGSTALSLGNAQGNNVSSIPYEWYRKRWYYRVDEDTENQRLNGGENGKCLIKENYLDTSSSQYNSEGIYSKESIELIDSEFGIKIDEKNDRIVSLTDMYTALEGKSIALNGLIKDDKVKIITDLKANENNRYSINKITFYGHASSQGNNNSEAVNETRNESLSKYRALTLKDWMMKNNFPNIDISTFEYVDGVQKGGNKNNVNDPKTKFWRSAYVKIEYEEENTQDAATVELPKGKEGITGTTNVRVEIDNGKSSSKTKNSILNAVTTDGKSTIGDALLNTDMAKYGALPQEEETIATTEEKPKVGRYDNEGEFFEVLDKEAPFLHHLISEKIRYFDPAFHTISPEGFNARLTFLHQCTRQGSTVEQSSFDSSTAYNLAFGRPPVCVLRIGDFYYTKIIINSLQISYDSPQWDMNPEGIGMMPMFAKITIQFTFLGGSDLAGPIARLQNAVSFNYYANTSVYDNRAEMVEYEKNGSGRETKFKGYIYPNRGN